MTLKNGSMKIGWPSPVAILTTKKKSRKVSSAIGLFLILAVIIAGSIKHQPKEEKQIEPALKIMAMYYLNEYN